MKEKKLELDISAENKLKKLQKNMPKKEKEKIDKEVENIKKLIRK